MISRDGLLSQTPDCDPLPFGQPILLTESISLVICKPDPKIDLDIGLLNHILRYDKDPRFYMDIVNYNHKRGNYSSSSSSSNNNSSLNHKNKNEDNYINNNKEYMIYYKGDSANKFHSNYKKLNDNNNNYNLPPSSQNNKVINLSSFSLPPSVFNFLGKD